MAYVFSHALSLCLLTAVIAAGGAVVERFAPQLSLPAYRPILRLVLGLLF